MTNLIYPEHIYEPIRVEVAKSYIRHELEKYLPSVTGAWREDIDRWFEGESVGLFPVRDLWNGFYGVLMGFKLLIHLIEFVTAENVIWTKEELAIEKLVFTDFGEYTPRFISKEPVIVTQKRIDQEDKFVVYDGNNRVNQAKKNGQKTIAAYVSRFKGEGRTPTNYWLATPIIYEVYSLAKKADKTDPMLYQAYVKVMKDMLAKSESGRYEFINRVPGIEDEFKKKFLIDLKDFI